MAKKANTRQNINQVTFVDLEDQRKRVRWRFLLTCATEYPNRFAKLFDVVPDYIAWCLEYANDTIFAGDSKRAFSWYRLGHKLSLMEFIEVDKTTKRTILPKEALECLEKLDCWLNQVKKIEKGWLYSFLIEILHHIGLRIDLSLSHAVPSPCNSAREFSEKLIDFLNLKNSIPAHKDYYWKSWQTTKREVPQPPKLPNWVPHLMSWDAYSELCQKVLLKYKTDTVNWHEEFDAVPPLNKIELEKHLQWLSWRVFGGLSFREIANRECSAGNFVGHSAIKKAIDGVADILGCTPGTSTTK